MVMNKQARTGIRRLARSVLIFLALAALAIAHGGFNHVRGTVVSITSDAITVKTATGNVTVKLDKQTQFTKGEQKAQISDVVPGARVIVEAPQAKDKAAQSVKIGEAQAQKGKK
jgi:hypothetical protein